MNRFTYPPVTPAELRPTASTEKSLLPLPSSTPDEEEVTNELERINSHDPSPRLSRLSTLRLGRDLLARCSFPARRIYTGARFNSHARALIDILSGIT